ncbi:MAG: signal recognition particle-docking protein FtsY [Peptostreptococcaceae bacterium]|nr:signal recognition particle-docking protein FtsY [Peptostreptococcaceae bacterium]
MGLFDKKSPFQKFSERVADFILVNPKIDEEFLEELEEILITSDIGIETTEYIMEELREKIKKEYIEDPEKVKKALTEIIAGIMDKGDRNKICQETPLVILTIGINGGGKTTSIGKMANIYKNEGKTVMIAAADTFRAAAADQLQIWADRVGVNVVRHEEGSDPAAVIYDAIQSAKSKNIDVLICDTAGRLQNKSNLMKELEKMNKIIGREFPEAFRETLLVLDATTGRNAISQAKAFSEIADITGLILTKLDGTARGGISITIANEFDMAVKYVGVGESLDDLKPFDPMEFAGGIFNE